jgi:hypothetical protein
MVILSVRLETRYWPHFQRTKRPVREDLGLAAAVDSTAKVPVHGIRVTIFALEKQYFECVFVALIIRLTNRVNHIILSSVACLAVMFFHIISYTARFGGGGGVGCGENYIT